MLFYVTDYFIEKFKCVGHFGSLNLSKNNFNVFENVYKVKYEKVSLGDEDSENYGFTQYSPTNPLLGSSAGPVTSGTPRTSASSQQAP